MIALTSPKITATTKMMPTLASVVSPPTKLIPGTTRVTTHSATPVSAARSRNDPMGSVCRTQQVRVHDPAMAAAGLGTHLGDPFADLPDRARRQHFVGRAQVSAPPDPGPRRACPK